MNSKEYAALRQELDTMLAIQIGQTALLTAMIQTHPRYEDLQMATTNALEVMLSKLPDKAMNDQMRTKTRAYVEDLQRVPPSAPGAPGAKARMAMPRA